MRVFSNKKSTVTIKQPCMPPNASRKLFSRQPLLSSQVRPTIIHCLSVILDYYSVFLFVALFLLFSLAQNKNLLVPQLIHS